MKHLKISCGVATALMITTTNVWAVEGVRQDNSGIFVWAFLSVCALIVVAQLVPALMLLLGFIKAAGTLVQKRIYASSRTPWMNGVHQGRGGIDTDEAEAPVAESRPNGD